MHSLLIDANRWGTHKIIQINNVLVVSSDRVCVFFFFVFRNISQSWAETCMQAVRLVLLWALLRNSLLEIKYQEVVFFFFFFLSLPLCSFRGTWGGKNKSSCCAKERNNSVIHIWKQTERFQWLLQITHNNINIFFITAAHIHGFFLRPARAHLQIYCTKSFLEHSVKGQFHKGRMIGNIYIWLPSHCNIYKRTKGTETHMSKENKKKLNIDWKEGWWTSAAAIPITAELFWDS